MYTPFQSHQYHSCLGITLITLAAFTTAMLASSAIAEEKRPAQKKTWEPKLYGFCMGMPGPKRRTIAEQSHMLRDLGFDGAGYELWFNGTLEKNLKTIDDAGPEIYLLHTGINLKADGLPYDARLPDAIRKLKGRPCTLCVLLRGYPPGDPRGQQRAVEILRELGDLSAASGIRLSIYHHKSDWTESLLFALEIVKKVNHKNVGVNFNLCHWLMVDGDKDYKPVLRDNSDKIFAVTINGAKVGSKTWTNGLIQPLDKGDFDNRELLATLREIGYGGPIGLMCYGIPGDAKDCLQRSMLVWKTWKADWLNDN